jgi:glycosyltransferase involved in cell wall biosynthesis
VQAVSRKRIIQVSLGVGYSGSAKFAILSTLGFRRLGHETLFVASKGSLTEQRVRKAGLDVEVLPGDRGEGYRVFRRVLDGFRPEFVVAHDSRERKYLMRHRRAEGRKFYAIAFRSIASASFPIVSSIPYNLWLDLNVACSRGVARSLFVRGILPSKVRIVYNGIDPPPELPPPAPEARAGMPAGAKLVGTSSAFHEKRKGYDILFSALGSHVPFPYRVLLLGIHPKQRKRAAELARSYGVPEELLVFPGYVEDVWPYYAAMDVYVLPSRKEGFSLSLLEAMASGLPVVASDIPGNNEAVAHGVNGLLFPVRKPAELGRALVELCENPDRARELGRAARSTVLERFTVEKVSADFDRVLEELRGRRPLGRQVLRERG